MTGARTNAGTETIAISAAVIKDASDNNVTANYDLHFVDGTLTITKRTGVVVTIQEHGKEVDYNATDQKVTGYSYLQYCGWFIGDQFDCHHRCHRQQSV